MTDWLTDRRMDGGWTDWLMYGGGLTDRRMGGVDWLTEGWGMDWLTDWRMDRGWTDWLMYGGGLTDRQKDGRGGLTDWRMGDGLTDWLTEGWIGGGLTDWQMDGWTAWLTSGMVELLYVTCTCMCMFQVCPRSAWLPLDKCWAFAEDQPQC